VALRGSLAECRGGDETRDQKQQRKAAARHAREASSVEPRVVLEACVLLNRAVDVLDQFRARNADGRNAKWKLVLLAAAAGGRLGVHAVLSQARTRKLQAVQPVRLNLFNREAVAEVHIEREAHISVAH